MTKFHSESIPNFSAAEMRIRELDHNIKKAKNKLEALKARKKIVCAKLRMLRNALSKKTANIYEREEDFITEMRGQLDSMTIVPKIPSEERAPEDIRMKLSLLNLSDQILSSIQSTMVENKTTDLNSPD